MEISVELDEETYRILERRAEENHFESTGEYCQRVLEILSEELEQDRFSDEDEVEQRLEDLGYLN